MYNRDMYNSDDIELRYIVKIYILYTGFIHLMTIHVIQHIWYMIYIYRKYIDVVWQYDNIMLYNMLYIRDRHIV